MVEPSHPRSSIIRPSSFFKSPKTIQAAMDSTLRDQLIAAGIIHINGAEAQPVLRSSRLYQPRPNDVESGHHRASFQRRPNSVALENKSEISLPPPANHSHMPIDRAITPDLTAPASHSISTAANVSLPGMAGDIHLPPPAHYAPLPIDGRPLKGPPAPVPVPPTPPPTGPSPGRYSPTLKAFAFALRPFLTLDEDLHATKQVMLVGSPLQYGIPTSLDDAEYLNEALYSVADPIQPEGTPVFSTRGVSYFEWLRA